MKSLVILMLFSHLANASFKERCQNWLKAHWISDDHHEYLNATDARLISWYYQVDKLNDGFYNEVTRRLQYGLVDPETAAQFRVILENMK